MKKTTSTFAIATFLWALTAKAGLAMSLWRDIRNSHGSGSSNGQGNANGGGVAAVPEIDAGSGLLALAAVAALVALFYELHRRRIRN